MLSAWGLAGAENLAKRCNAVPPPDFAQLFPAVLEAAKGGDASANDLLDSAGERLADLAAAAIGRLWPPKDAVRVALAGGVFRCSPEVRHAFYSNLRVLWPHAAVNFKITEPVTGALWMARQAAAARLPSR
jgi:N-acetylglucosamine kinase-like BadF-type ATPase